MKIKETEHNFGDFFYSLENNIIYKYRVTGVNFNGCTAGYGGPIFLDIEQVKPTYIGLRYDSNNGEIITKSFDEGNPNYCWNVEEILEKLKNNIQ